MKASKVLAIVILLVMTMAMSVAPTAGASDSITVALGEVRDASGNPIANASVEVDLWRNTDVPVGESVDIIILAEGSSDDSGRFELAVTDPTLIAEFLAAATRNGGFANLELSVYADNLSYTTFYSLGSATTQPVTATPAPESYVVGMTRRPLGNRTVTMAPGKPGVTRIEPVRDGGPRPPCLTWYKTADLTSQWGTIGEVHRWGEWIPKDRFVYGATADSDFDVAFYNGSSWGVQGSAHVGNSNGSSGSASVTTSQSSTGYQIEGLFKRAEFAQVCTSNKKREATQWDGVNVRLGPAISGLDGQCATYPASYRNTFSSTQDGWSRDSNQAYKWGGALNLGVLTVGGRSGYSTRAQSNWTFKVGQNKTLCGNDAYITSSHRVFAGL